MELMQLCLRFIHLLINFKYIFVNSLLKAAHPLKYTLFYFVNNGYSRFLTNEELVKVPVHIALVVNEVQIYYDDIANIISWCVNSGISYISLYDMKGQLKSNQFALEKAIEKHNSVLQSSTTKKSSLVLRTTKHNDQAYSSSHKSRESNLLLLAPSNGRQTLVDTAKLLSHNVCAGQCTLDQITPYFIDNILQDEHGFPDPDVCIRFGTAESMLGYMPWQIRLTEIFSLTSHRHLDAVSFQNTLRKYCSTKQRFGK